MAVSFIGGGNRSNKSLTKTGFELTTIVVISTDCIGSYKSNYHRITSTTAPSGDIEVREYVKMFKYQAIPLC